eukprot:gene5546-172_t
MGKNKNDKVKVVIRCRPLNSDEHRDNRKECVAIDENTGTITVNSLDVSRLSPFARGSAKEPRVYTFDNVYGMSSLQENIYNTSALPIVDAVLEGFNGTIFAYGQTGTGKTFTMNGENSPELKGIIPRSFEHIFDVISKGEGKQYLVRASYLEIYMEDIRDLLSKDQSRKLAIRESPDTGIYVEDLSSIVVKNVKEIDKVMRVGSKNRKVGVTQMNEHSSRSHAIFIINVECSETGADGEAHIRSGKLNLVDLAGSERQDKTMAEGERAKEGTLINLSLSALGQVIKTLVENKGHGHVPYRNSSLTRLLQDALLRKYQEEISVLRKQLESKGRKHGAKRKKVKVIRYDDQGQPIQDDASDGEEDANEDENEQYNEEEARRIREQAFQQLEEEKQRMLQDQTMLQDEKDRLLREMEEKQMQMQAEEQAAAELSAKIAALESRLLVGGKDINEYTAEQEERLRRERERVQQEKQKAELLQQQLEQHETQRMLAEDKFTNLRDKVKSKTEKLEKLFHKYQSIQEELTQLDEMFYEQRDNIMLESEETRKQLRLKELIIEHFMPPEEAEKFRKRAVFDEETQEYLLLSATHTAGANSAGLVERPMSAFPNRARPITLFAQMQSGIDQNPRYRNENIMNLELAMPERTTQDYTGPAVDARVQEVLNDALHDDEELVMEEPIGDFNGEGIKSAKRELRRRKGASSSRLKRPGAAKGSKKKTNSATSNTEFPTARGLVSK